MKETIIKKLQKETKLTKTEIENLLEIPPSPELGDYAFPCFTLAKELKKAPTEISQSMLIKLSSPDFEKVEARGPYINFFLNKTKLAEKTIAEILEKKEKYSSSNLGKNKTVVIEFSSPNIAKPFGIGHLRSTIIGNSLSNIADFLHFKTKRINYIGDWGTPFGKIIAGYKKFGSEKELNNDPIKHLYRVYVKASKDDSFEEEGRTWFKKMEAGDKEALVLWKRFKEESLKEFGRIYESLGVKFDVMGGESEYNKKMDFTLKELEKKKLLEKSEGAEVVNLEKYNLGISLIRKSDGATLYATRDLTAAIDRHKQYKFSQMIYEVGSEQKLYFKQLFKILELLGYGWAKDCVHVEHGLYLDKDGKKFATRKGKTIFMEDVLLETQQLAEKELKKREKLSKEELKKRATAIARAAIFYGDLKNHRAHDVVFDIKRLLSFEGNTGPYLLYTYARARSILRKARYKERKFKIKNLSESEKILILQFAKFEEIVQSAYKSLTPHIVANYAYQLSQNFNEFYHKNKVIGAKDEDFKLSLVDAFSQILKNSLNLLGITTLEKM